MSDRLATKQSVEATLAYALEDWLRGHFDVRADGLMLDHPYAPALAAEIAEFVVALLTDGGALGRELVAASEEADDA